MYYTKQASKEFDLKLIQFHQEKMLWLNFDSVAWGQSESLTNYSDGFLIIISACKILFAS